MATKVLITRPYDQAKLFAAEVEQLGAIPLCAPLLDINRIDCAFSGAIPQAIIFTSRHAVTAHMPDAWKALPVFVVGESVARAASEVGFSNIASISPSVADLCTTLAAVSYMDIAYVRGCDVSADVSRELPSKKITEYIVYEAIASKSLPQDIIEHMSDIGVITVFSSRTAQVLGHLLTTHGLNHYKPQIKLLCLSSAVLDSIGNEGWMATYVAHHPDQSAMIAALERILQVDNDDRRP